MTTWDEPCYTTDTLSTLLRHCPREDKYVKDLLTKFPITITNWIGLEVKPDDDLYDIFTIRKLFPHAFTNKNEHLITTTLHLANGSHSIKTGLAAVYHLWHQFLAGDLEYNNECNLDLVNAYVERSAEFDFFGSKFTPKRIKELVQTAKMPVQTYSLYRRCLNAAYTVTHVAYFWRANSHKAATDKARRGDAPAPEINKHAINLGKHCKAYTFPGLQLYSHTDKRTDEITLCVLDMKSMRRLAQLLRSSGKILSYYHVTEHRTGTKGIAKTACEILLDLAHNAHRTDRHNEVARAYDVLFNWELAKVASDIWDRSLKMQQDKFRLNNYSKIVSEQHFFGKINKYKVFERLDLAKLYKILPCPDFDPFTGFWNMKQYHDTPNSVFTIPKNLQADMEGVQCSLAEMHLYRKLMFVRRYASRHRQLPGGLDHTQVIPQHLVQYPHMDPKSMKLEDMPFLDLRGAAVWKDTDNNNPAYYTDKACAPQSINLNNLHDAHDWSKLSQYDKSFLVWFMGQTEVPYGHEIRKQYVAKRWAKQQLAYFKPESKKPEPRNFYSAPPLMRRMVSEYEENAREYLKHDVASFMGLTPHDTRLALNKILGTQNDRERFKWVWISFDLEKFSPRMPAEYKDLTFYIWDMVFDQPDIGAVRDAFKDTELHFIHEGIHQTYTVPSVDLEGQSATINTAMHTDLMGYAVRKLRHANYLKEAGRLAVFVDDGLLGLPFPPDTPNSVIVRAANIIDAVYQYFGMKISWDKTFMSSRVAVFLNEIYYDGVNVTTGVKAFLKMQPTKLEDELSLAGKIKGLTSMAEGTIPTGVPPFLAKIELLRELYLLITRNWKQTTKRLTPPQMAYYTHLPIALGGLGLPFTDQLLQSPNADPLENFQSIMLYMVTTQPHLKPVTDISFSTDLRQRSDIAILRQPKSVRILGKTLTETKHIPYVLATVRALAKHRTLVPMLHTDMNELATSILDSLGDDPTDQEVTMAYKCSIVNTIDTFLGKFKRSSTMIGMIKQNVRHRIIARYISEFHVVTSQFLATYNQVV